MDFRLFLEGTSIKLAEALYPQSDRDLKRREKVETFGRDHHFKV